VGTHEGARGEYTHATRHGVKLFDLARRFALLESAAGPSTVHVTRVVAEGNSSACVQCGWRVLATDDRCENCGIAYDGGRESTVGLGLPAPVITTRRDRFTCDAARARILEDEYTALRFSRFATWKGREAWRCGPKEFRHRVAALAASLDRDDAIDVLCSSAARPRWLRVAETLRRPVDIHTPRSLVAHRWREGALLVVDAASAFDPTSRTFHRVALAPHRFLVARASEKRYTDPDRVFALTDLVTPGTFASLAEARKLHRCDLASFVDRRDSVMGAPAFIAQPSNAELPPDATQLALVGLAQHGLRVRRSAATLAVTPRGLVLMHSASPFWNAASHRPLDASAPSLAPERLHDLFEADAAETARALAATLARLARAYAERVDLAPRAARAGLATEFARRADLLVAHGSLRVCMEILASVRLSTDARS
jgi:hypothetical protein